MPSAINIDRSPRAPGQTLTPYELANRDGLLGVWLACAIQHDVHRAAPGPCLHGAGGEHKPRQSADIAPHSYQFNAGLDRCEFCPFLPGHAVHRIQPVDDYDTERLLGEREEQPA